MNIFWVVLGILLILNTLVSVFLIKRDDLDKAQKVLQATIVWLLPFLGAIGIWLLNRSQDDDDKPSGDSFGGGSGGGIAGGVQ
jgi:hypothetical protein